MGAEQPPRGTILPQILAGAGHLVAYHVVTEGRCFANIIDEEPYRRMQHAMSIHLDIETARLIVGEAEKVSAKVGGGVQPPTGAPAIGRSRSTQQQAAAMSVRWEHIVQAGLCTRSRVLFDQQ